MSLVIRTPYFAPLFLTCSLPRDRSFLFAPFRPKMCKKLGLLV